MANTADTTAAGKIIEVTFTGSGADWNHSTDGGFADMMHVKSIIWHPSGADDILVMNEGGLDGPSIVHWKAYADLVSNGSFTANTTGWTAESSATLASVSGGQSGNCLRITGNGDDNPFAYQQNSAIEGKPHKFTCYVKAGTEATYRVILRDIKNATNFYDTTDTEEEAGDWSTKIQKRFIVPAGCSTIRITLFQRCAADAATTIFYDEVTMKELPLNKQIDFGEKGVPLKPYIDISDCTFSDITATKIIFILE